MIHHYVMFPRVEA